LVVGLFVIVMAGCGGSENELPRAAVQGTVSLDGQPLAKGVVRFVPIEETTGPKTTLSITAGKFETEVETGPVLGRHRIEIESTDDGGYAQDDEAAMQELKKSGKRKINVVRVPARYNTNSTLTESVSAQGPNEFQFTLTTNKRR